MNKGDLINELAKVAGKKKDAEAAVNTIFGAMLLSTKREIFTSLI